MAQQNGGGPSRGRAAAVKEEEKQSSGILPYVVGGLAGVAVGLLGSLLIDKVVENVEASQQAQAMERSGCCEANNCAVCLDEATPTFRTRCCGQHLHNKCLMELRRNSHSKCPFCRSSSWLG